jgi:hypothetical protein
MTNIDPAYWLYLLSQQFSVPAPPPSTVAGASTNATIAQFPFAPSAAVAGASNAAMTQSTFAPQPSAAVAGASNAVATQFPFAPTLSTVVGASPATGIQGVKEHVCATTNSAWVPTIGEKFTNPDEFMAKVKHYAQASGFNVGKTFTYNRDSQAVAKNNGMTQVKQGVIYCTSLPGSKSDKKCSFHIKFGFRTRTVEYIVTNVELSHTHTTKPIELDGRRHVTKLVDLSQDDLVIIHDIAEYCSNFCKAKEHLDRKIPHKHIDGSLFRREFIKAKENIYGPNNGRMPQLFEKGNDIKREGGVFETTIDPITQRLATLLLQTIRMQQYVAAYGDFFLMDGTHGLNRYKLIVIVFCVIDCLGRTVTPGFAFDNTENTNISVEAATRFGFDKPGLVCMSDRAPAFVALAELMDFIHILCAWHYNGTTSKTH